MRRAGARALGGGRRRAALAAPPRSDLLLEREGGVLVLAEALDAVRASTEGRLMLVAGESGVGKTMLLRRFCELQEASVRILWGACEPLLAPRPLGPFVDVADTIGGELEELVGGAARPHLVAGAVLRELRRHGLTILVLEDVHWADEATLDVLALLAARIGAAPALMVASYRDDELDRAERFRVVLGSSLRVSGRLKVEGLSLVGVEALAQPHAVDADELYRRTGGNPFFVTEVLAAGGELIPDTVRDAVLARAAHLSEAARRLLEAVAVIPGHVDLWLLELLVPEHVERLEECLGSGVLIAGRAHVAFRHELARLAIEEAISPSRRLVLHRRALDALVAHHGGDGDLARLAYHADAAGDVDGVLRWAPQAAERAAAAGAHREAAEQYARALRFADRLALDARAALLTRRAEECYMTDQHAAALDAQASAVAARRQLGDRRAEADAVRLFSRLLRYVGRTADAHRAALEAVELLEPLPPSRELVLAYCNVSHLGANAEDRDTAVAWAERALELAQALGDAEGQVYALTNIGVTQLLNNEPIAARATIHRVLELAERHGLEEHHGRALVTLVLWPVRQRMYTLAAEHLDTGLDYCTEHGLDTWRLYLLAARARLELDTGRWNHAADSAALVVRDARSARVPRSWALVVLGLVGARRGEADPSDPLAEAESLSRSSGELQRLGPVAAAQAEVAWLHGDPVAAQVASDEALALALRYHSPWVAGELLYWRRQAGLHDDLPAAGIAEPYALSLAGHPAGASDRWAAIGCPYEAALALADSDDTTDVNRSIVQLQQIGARAASALIARRLRGRGVRHIPRGPRPATRANPAGLTARELDVLTLLDERLTNAQIAQRLVVTEKTVEHHVSAVLRKLDARTRHEASAAAARAGITPHGA